MKRKTAVLNVLNRKNSRVNCVKTEKKIALTALNRTIAGLTAVNWKSSGVNNVEPKNTALTEFNREKSGVNGVEPEK